MICRSPCDECLIATLTLNPHDCPSVAQRSLSPGSFSPTTSSEVSPRPKLTACVSACFLIRDPIFFQESRVWLEKSSPAGSSPASTGRKRNSGNATPSPHAQQAPHAQNAQPPKILQHFHRPGKRPQCFFSIRRLRQWFDVVAISPLSM